MRVRSRQTEKRATRDRERRGGWRRRGIAKRHVRIQRDQNVSHVGVDRGREEGRRRMRSSVSEKASTKHVQERGLPETANGRHVVGKRSAEILLVRRSHSGKSREGLSRLAVREKNVRATVLLALEKRSAREETRTGLLISTKGGGRGLSARPYRVRQGGRGGGSQILATRRILREYRREQTMRLVRVVYGGGGGGGGHGGHGVCVCVENIF